jgi:hypothetical protein
MTRTLPVAGSSATTAPSRPPSASTAIRWAFGSSVVRTSLPRRASPDSWSRIDLTPFSWPVSGSLRDCSRPKRPTVMNE